MDPRVSQPAREYSQSQMVYFNKELTESSLPIGSRAPRLNDNMNMPLLCATQSMGNVHSMAFAVARSS